MKSIFRLFFIIFWCFSGLWPTFAAGQSQTNPDPAGSLTLAEALSRVLQSSPELRASELEVQAADARILQAGFRPNPDISAEAQNLPAISSHDVLQSTEAAISLSQRIEIGGKRSLRVKNATVEKATASHRAALTRAELITRTRLEFANVLAHQQRLANFRALTGLARQAHSIVLERIGAGKASPVEAPRSALALEAAQLEEEKQREELKASKDRLAYAWGGNSDSFERASGDFVIPELSSNLEACIDRNPDLRLAAATIESRRSSLELQRALRVPDITVSGGYRRSNLDGLNYWVAGVSIPLPLFNKQQGAIAEAGIGLEKASLEHKNVDRAIRARLAQERHNYAVAVLEATAIGKNALPAAEQALAASEEGYRLGKFEYHDVLDSLRTHAELQRRYIEAIAAGMKAAIEIDRLAGCHSPLLTPKEASDEK